MNQNEFEVFDTYTRKVKKMIPGDKMAGRHGNKGFSVNMILGKFKKHLT